MIYGSVCSGIEAAMKRKGRSADFIRRKFTMLRSIIKHGVLIRAHWAYDDATAAEARHVIGRCGDTKLHDLAWMDAIRRHGEPGVHVRFRVIAAAVVALVALAGVLAMREV